MWKKDENNILLRKIKAPLLLTDCAEDDAPLCVLAHKQKTDFGKVKNK